MNGLAIQVHQTRNAHHPWNLKSKQMPLLILIALVNCIIILRLTMLQFDLKTHPLVDNGCGS